MWYVQSVTAETGAGIRVIVVMGVAAAGKTTVGRALADKLCWTFYEGDDFHSKLNIEKMHRGEALTDEDRGPWLEKLQSIAADVIRRDSHAVLACSALREVYRAALIPPNATEDTMPFVFLDAPRNVLFERLHDRHHFFPPELLDSQLSTLEKPTNALVLDGTRPVIELVTAIRDSLGV